MRKIAVFGAGGLGREVACIIREINEKSGNRTWDFIGFFDDGLAKGTSNEFGEVLGSINELNDWNDHLALAIGIGNPEAVRKIVAGITNENISYPNIIAPDVKFLDKSGFRIGKGNFFNFRGTVSCGVSVGDFNTIGAFSTLGHDCKIGDFNTIMPSVMLCGYVEVGCNNFFGLNSIVLQMKKVGNNITLGAGSILMKDAEDGLSYFGNPARQLLKK